MAGTVTEGSVTVGVLIDGTVTEGNDSKGNDAARCTDRRRLARVLTEGNDTAGVLIDGVLMAGTVTEGDRTDGSDEAGVVMAGTVTGGKVTGGSDEPSVLTDGWVWDSDCPLDDAGERVPETGRLADGSDTEESAAVFGVGAVGIRPFAVLRFVEEGAELTTVPTAAPTAEPREDGDGAGWFALVEGEERGRKCGGRRRR